MEHIHLPLAHNKHTTAETWLVKNQPHEYAEHDNVALCSDLYKMLSWAPRGGVLHSRLSSGKVCCIAVLTGIEHGAHRLST